MKFLFYIPLLIIVASSCDSKSLDSNKKVFRYNESSGITSLDPAFAKNLEEMWVVNQLFDGLVEMDEQGKVVPLIAKSWQVVDSGKTYIFDLRDDVYFHKNQYFDSEEKTRKVVAEDFVYSFNRIVDPSVASPGQWVFSSINFEKNGGYEALDNHRLAIYLKEPFTPFLGMLTMQYFDVVPKEVVENLNQDFRSQPIGTGPFKFAFWYDQIALVFHKNENFWQKDSEGLDLPYLDAVKIDFVKDMSSEYLGLLKGEYDFMSGIDPSFKDELLNPSGSLNATYLDMIYFQKVPFIKTDYLGILVDDSLELSNQSPLRFKKVRQALNYAIHREEMVRYLRNNSVFEAGHGFIPKGLPSYNASKSYGYSYQPEKARELLSQAGFPNGKGLEVLTLSTTKDYVDLCEFIQHNLSEIGVQVNIDVLPTSKHRESVSKSQVEFFRKSWLADYVDAENFLSLFYSKNFSPSGPNYTHFKSELFDQMFEEARQEVDDQERYDLYASMDSLIMDEAPVIPLFYDQVSHFISNDIVNFETNAFNLLDLKEVKKK